MAKDRKSLVSSIVSNLQVGFGKDGLNGRKELTGYALGTESMDSIATETAVSNMGKIDAVVKNSIDMVLSSEEFGGVDFTPAQIMAAQKVAALAFDPSAAMSSLKDLRPVGSKNDNVLEASTLGVEDFVTPNELAVEAYDGQAIENSVYFSVVANLLSAKQDEFGEGFFPTIVIDPTASGIAIETEFTSVFTEFDRSISGTANKALFNKTPLVKAIYDNNIFGIDKNRVVPVNRTESQALLYGAYTYTSTVSGEDVTTSPVKFGEVVNLLGISQTDSLLAKGVMNETDALDRTMNLAKVYYKLDGVDGSGTAISEAFSLDTSILPYSNFVYTAQDHEKDLTLNFATVDFVLNTTDTAALTGASVILAGLAANHTIKLSAKIVGDANTQYGDVEVNVVSIKLDSVYDSNGNKILETTTTYTDIAAVITTIAGVGYELEAYRTNSNLRTKGNSITSDKYTQIYTVPMRSGLNITTSINNSGGNNNDSKLATHIQSLGMKVSISAVDTLIKTTDVLRAVTANGIIQNADILGVGRYHVDTYFAESNIDLSTHVDSVNSNSRMEDIKAALVNKIKDTVLDMYIDSNYSVAFEALRGGVDSKVTVLIGTDTKTKQYLTTGDGIVNIGAQFDVKVVSSSNPAVKGKMFMTFIVDDADKNIKPNELSFGQCVWAPTVTVDVSRTTSGATNREMFTMPRYLHIVNLPIMSVLNISGYAQVVGKISAYRTTV